MLCWDGRVSWLQFHNLLGNTLAADSLSMYARRLLLSKAHDDGTGDFVKRDHRAVQDPSMTPTSFLAGLGE